MKRRIMSILLVLTLIIGMVPFSAVPVQAAGATLAQLEAKYPHGKYWNGRNADSYTSTPCTHHGNCSKNNTDYSGWCGCNSYKGKAIQCHGFAYQLAYLVYGGDPYSDWTANYNVSALNNLKAGDVVRYKNKGHSIFVTAVNGDTVTYADCNSDGQCKIRWNQTISKSTLKSTFTYVDPAPYEWSTGTTHTHSYSGYYWEAAHPHRCYKQCSCGATKYITDEYHTYTDGSCSSCSMVQNSKFNTVKGFKAYPCVTANFEVKKSDLTTRNGEIYTTDFCTINEIYTNGWCKVTFPMDSGGTRTAYTQISKFIKTPSSSLTKYTASSYINLYSTSSLSTQIYRIYPGDVCYTIGTSGSATQIFMPMNSGGYYVLGWVSTSALSGTSSSAEKLSPGLTSLSASSYAKCYTITSGRYNVYTSSALTTRGYEGTASSSAWTGEGDEIWIIGVGVNSAGTAYAKIKYPVGDSRYTAYVPLHSTLVPGSLNGSYRTAIKKVTGFSDRPGGAINNSYWVELGEKVYLLSQQNGYSQVLYPTSSAWRIAWCTNSIYNSMFKAQTYTVTYNANGGTGAPAAQTKTRDVDLTLSSTKPTRTGYTFVGWATSSTATTAKYSAGSVYTNEATITLYAVWRKQTFTITYNANGGANAPGVQTQTYGTAITVTSEQPEKIHTVSFNTNGGTTTTSYYSLDCTFTSWNTTKSGTGTTVKAGTSYKPNANVTLYAIYTNPTLGNYPIPSRAGYTFNGWYTAANGGTRVDATTIITANTTLYAQWTLETYSVIYFDDGSSNIPAEQTKTHGTALTLSSIVPVKDGYTFKGWATDEDSSKVVYSPGAQYTQNEWVILYAVWEKNPTILSSVSIESMPSKTTYQIGDVLDTSGLTLKLTYSDNSIETVSSGFTTSGFDSTTAGTKTVTVSYGDETVDFTVIVETTAVDKNAPQITVQNKTAKAGQTVLIEVALNNNPGIWGMDLVLDYDESQLTLTNVTNGTVFSLSEWTQGNLSGDKYILSYEASGFDNITSNGVLATLEFTVSENATADSFANVSLSYNIGDIINVAFEDINVAVISGGIDITDFVYGDLNGDGLVNKKDSLLMKMYLSDNSTTIDMQAADVYVDGSINKKDSLYLKQYLAGLDVELGS